MVSRAVPTAAACVRILRDSAAGLGREVVHSRDVRASVQNRHSLGRGADEFNPNPWMTGTQFWRWVFGEIYARGECMIYIERNAMGRPVGLVPARITHGGYASWQYSRTTPEMAGAAPVWLSVADGGVHSYGWQRTITTTFSDVMYLTDESYDPFSGRAKSPLACKARNPDRYVQDGGRQVSGAADQRWPRGSGTWRQSQKDTSTICRRKRTATQVSRMPATCCRYPMGIQIARGRQIGNRNADDGMPDTGSIRVSAWRGAYRCSL